MLLAVHTNCLKQPVWTNYWNPTYWLYKFKYIFDELTVMKKYLQENQIQPLLILINGLGTDFGWVCCFVLFYGFEFFSVKYKDKYILMNASQLNEPSHSKLKSHNSRAA